jgi:hypothetical protein
LPEKAEGFTTRPQHSLGKLLRSESGACRMVRFGKSFISTNIEPS